MFTVEERMRLREWLIEVAQSDPRVVAGAEVGSLALGGGDRWSDLDLTFAVMPANQVDEVFAEWTGRLEREHRAVRLFDLHAGAIHYRVFLFPGCLQVDLSLTPEAVAQTSPRFRELFGTAFEEVAVAPVDVSEVFGLCVHHALRARFGVERGKLWSAEYYLVELLHETLTLACLRRGLAGRFARGYDDLPSEVLERAARARARSLDPAEMLRALREAVALFRAEAVDIETLDAVAPTLEELVAEEIGPR